MLSRKDDWVWDSWYVVADGQLHAFTLTAPKSLGDSELRHVNARVGHSMSPDGVSWTHLPDALGPSASSSVSDGDDDLFDSQATWTGSVVRNGDLWHMFYTGIDRTHREHVQTIGHATSTDLTSWTKISSTPVARATNDYAHLGNSVDGWEHFRDPWVFHHEGEWHMLVTASEPNGMGTIAHATSHNLDVWQVHPPLVRDSGFRQLEVTETMCVDGKWFLLFCAAKDDVLRSGVTAGWGTYCAPADGPIGPFHLDRAELFAPNVYAARAVYFNGEWVLFGFLGDGTEAGFEGVISDPLPLRQAESGSLELLLDGTRRDA